MLVDLMWLKVKGVNVIKVVLFIGSWLYKII